MPFKIFSQACKYFVMIFMAVILTTGCATYRKMELGAAKLAFSSKDEANIGNQYSQEIAKESKFITDPAVQAWVDRLGQKLVANSPPCEQQFTFHVTDSPEVNAFAIPGGFCYVNAGLINQADNEAEVAAVVGHEINHVTQRHGMRSMERQMGLGLVTQIASADPRTATAAQLISSSGGLVAMRSFGRQDEREADFYGVEAMYKAGYDPRYAITFFEKLRAGEQSGSSIFKQALSTHPATKERIENIKKQIAGYDFSRPLASNTPEFANVKKIARANMAPPAAPANNKGQGFRNRAR